MDRRIKLRHIEVFVEISRARSLKRAGEALGLTQPAMSKILKELEDILGAVLMQRDRGGVRLTPAGDVFLQFAQSSLGALQQGFDGVARLQQGGGRGAITVGALPSVAARLLPRASLAFRDLSPETLLFFEDGPHGFLMNRLRSGELDLAVGRMGSPGSMRGVSFTALYSESVAVVARPGHPLAESTRLTDLREALVVYPSPSSAIRPLVDRLLIAEGLTEFPQRIETVSGAYGRGLVRGSDAVWIISESVVAGDVDSGYLVKLPIDTRLTAGPVGVMTRAEEAMPPAVRLFRRALGSAVEEIGF